MKNKEIVEIDGKTCGFRIDFNFQQVEEIKESYRKYVSFSKPNWWYRKSDFALYFLKKIGVNLPLNFDVPKKEWYKVIPVLRHYFVTISEFKAIINNCIFLAGGDVLLVEDKWFTTYMLMRNFGSVKENNINNMSYKSARVLFIYSITEYVIKRNQGNPEENIYR